MNENKMKAQFKVFHTISQKSQTNHIKDGSSYTKKTTVNNLQINEDPIKIRTSRLVGLCHRASNGPIETWGLNVDVSHIVVLGLRAAYTPLQLTVVSVT